MTEPKRTLKDLGQQDDFVDRHIGPNAAEIDSMLQTLGIPSLDALVERAVPPSIFERSPLGLPESRTESDVLQSLRRLGARNDRNTSVSVRLSARPRGDFSKIDGGTARSTRTPRDGIASNCNIDSISAAFGPICLPTKSSCCSRSLSSRVLFIVRRPFRRLAND